MGITTGLTAITGRGQVWKAAGCRRGSADTGTQKFVVIATSNIAGSTMIAPITMAAGIDLEDQGVKAAEENIVVTQAMAENVAVPKTTVASIVVEKATEESIAVPKAMVAGITVARDGVKNGRILQ